MERIEVEQDLFGFTPDNKPDFNISERQKPSL